MRGTYLDTNPGGIIAWRHLGYYCIIQRSRKSKSSVLRPTLPHLKNLKEGPHEYTYYLPILLELPSFNFMSRYRHRKAINVVIMTFFSFIRHMGLTSSDTLLVKMFLRYFSASFHYRYVYLFQKICLIFPNIYVPLHIDGRFTNGDNLIGVKESICNISHTSMEAPYYLRSPKL